MKHKSIKFKKHNNNVLNPGPPLPFPALSQPAPVQPPANSGPASQLDPQRAFDLESINRKQRADSFYRKLSPDQQRTLLQWLEDIDDLSEILDRVTAPPPEGFGLAVHYTSLQRFRSFIRSLNWTAANQEILDTIRDMEANGDVTQSVRIEKAINQLLLRKAFELAETEPGSDMVPRILTAINKLSTLELKRQRLILNHFKITHAPRSPRSTTHNVKLTVHPASPQASIAVQSEPAKLHEKNPNPNRNRNRNRKSHSLFPKPRE